MKLYATPKSHFSRKVRLLLDHLSLPYELIDIGNVAEAAPDHFGKNPVMSVPVLEDGETWLIESDHIARYIARQWDQGDPFAVLTENTDLLNARAVMNGVMSNEVKLILSQRTGLDPSGHAYFEKAKQSILQCLAWLEDRADLFPLESLSYAHFHFISMWDHLKLYALVPLPYPRLERLANHLGAMARVARSAPE